LQLGFAPGLPRGRNLGVYLIHGKLVQPGFIGAGPRSPEPFRRKINPEFRDLLFATAT
jgi:hypothetical protein